MSIDQNSTQIRKGLLDVLVLICLNKEQKYPNEILQMLNQVKIDLSEGTLYPLLNRLKNEGLLTYKWVESNSGPPRKYFFITEAGKNFIQDRLKILHDIFQSIDKLSKLNEI